MAESKGALCEELRNKRKAFIQKKKDILAKKIELLNDKIVLLNLEETINDLKEDIEDMKMMQQQSSDSSIKVEAVSDARRMKTIFWKVRLHNI
ncbi:hypothetical protein RIF29_19032 [Crotalaria pallida]|uniref:Uncharacterized protein n=1 Tax=Crotalaria pallida TaxID=3830 RepID=A0AAN9F730_CROPI